MNRLDRLAGRAGTTANVVLGIVFAAALVVDGALTARHGGDWPFAGVAYLPPGHGGNWQFECGVGAVVCAAAVLRARNRALAAVTGLAVVAGAEVAARLGHLPGQPGAAATLGLLVLAGAAIRMLPVRQATAIAAAGVAVAAAGMLPAGPGLISGPTQIAMVGWPTALGVGVWLRSFDGRRRAALEAVRREERLELARELHDVVAHHITGIVLQAQAARLVGRRNPDTFDATLTRIESAGADALTAIRRVVGLLRDTDDTAGVTPGPEQLSELVGRFAGHGPPVALHLPTGPGEPDWPPEVTTTVYRVVQEALTNVARHAPDANSVTVTVAHDQRAVTVEITDDGPAGTARRHPHLNGYGLVGMRERVESLGGKFCAGPHPRAGWSVLATLPIPAPGRP